MSSIILQGVEVAELLTSVRQIVEQAVKASTPPPATVAEPDRYIDQKEVAKIFGVSGVSVWSWERAGLLKAYRIGNLKRFKYSEVMRSPRAIERAKKK
ncbi:MAG: hypothetical protein R2822_08835 [Spirosomataceae bacterium]